MAYGMPGAREETQYTPYRPGSNSFRAERRCSAFPVSSIRISNVGIDKISCNAYKRRNQPGYIPGAIPGEHTEGPHRFPIQSLHTQIRINITNPQRYIP